MNLKIETYDFSSMFHSTSNQPYKLKHLEGREKYFYAARPFINHPKYSYWEAFLIPHLNLQLNKYYQHSGKYWCDAYIDIATIKITKEKLIVTDLFIDICVSEQQRAYVLDFKDFDEALKQSLMSPELITTALTSFEYLMNSLAKHNYAVQSFLDAENIAIDWYKSIP